ncbi:MAG: Smr/MutS family protein [Gammaproteobacteria bacterium]|nr:Smr/MutS family protein [Gammaproteobacteria bacterium]
MTRKGGKNPETDDARTFKSLVGPVEPVKARHRVPLRKPPPPPRARFTQADEEAVLKESLSGQHGDLGLETGEELSFRRPHIPIKVLKDLKRGKYSIQDELDLPGLTASEARVMLREFMADVLLQGHRCVRIVHGKGLRSGPGGPVLKVKLNKWLPQWDQVLAFTTAPARDGGTGALYVLLVR